MYTLWDNICSSKTKSHSPDCGDALQTGKCAANNIIADIKKTEKEHSNPTIMGSWCP
jgi:NADH dehydrogenase FAD-containing subunit